MGSWLVFVWCGFMVLLQFSGLWTTVRCWKSIVSGVAFPRDSPKEFQNTQQDPEKASVFVKSNLHFEKVSYFPKSNLHRPSYFFRYPIRRPEKKSREHADKSEIVARMCVRGTHKHLKTHIKGSTVNIVTVVAYI